MADSPQREKSVESITSKEMAKAELDTKIADTKEALASQKAELTNVKQYIADLHAKCDFILENFDMRKAARENEVEGLNNAKSVLSGGTSSRLSSLIDFFQRQLPAADFGLTI